MLIDTHCHLNDEQLENDTKDIIERAKEHNVKKLVCVGASLSSSVKAVEIANEYDNVFAVIGVHPDDANTFNDDILDKLRELAKNNKKVVAIGEIGLDYHFVQDNKEAQKQCFIKQIELANELDLPIVIHTRDAMGDTLDIVRKYKDKIKKGGIFHCFHGSKEVLCEINKMGFYVSYGGAITFNNANSLREIVKQTPLDKILTETDCPYMAPVPLRGTLNEPKNIDLIFEKMCEIKNISKNELEKIIENNTKKIFNI